MTDGLEVKNPQKGFTYKWLNKTPVRVLKFESEGWEVCTGKDKQTTALGDMVLARISDVLAEKKREYLHVKPIIQQGNLTGSYFYGISEDKTEEIYRNRFITPYTFMGRIKGFINFLKRKFDKNYV